MMRRRDMTNPFRHPAMLAAAAKGIPSATVLCRCCQGYVTRPEFPKPGEYATEPALIARYGSMPCTTCTERHVECVECGKLLDEGEGHEIQIGTVCEACRAECYRDPMGDAYDRQRDAWHVDDTA